MSTFISEPGTRLGGRYRLEDRMNDSGGWSAWKAIDETLARPVSVLTFAPGFPRIREVLTAARAASRLTDARLAQVFDVEDDWDQAYVVMEWVAGDSLDDLLADGPLEPARGAEIVAEAAEALAAAHAAGVAHLCLTPQSLRWTPGGGVKVLGVGIDAALADVTADDPALADTRGLAMLLYAALTRYWPGPGMGTLPPAPLADGQPCSPRQVCAGVPASIDEVTCQALFQRERRRGPPLTTPALLADALAEVIPAPLAPPPAAAPARVAASRPNSPARLRAPTEYAGAAAGRRRDRARSSAGAFPAAGQPAAGQPGRAGADRAARPGRHRHRAVQPEPQQGRRRGAGAERLVGRPLVQPGRRERRAHAGQGGRLRRARPGQRSGQRGQRRGQLRHRRQPVDGLAHPVLRRQPGLRRPEEGHRPDPGHGQAGEAELGADHVRPGRRGQREHQGGQQQHRLAAGPGLVHQGGQGEERRRGHPDVPDQQLGPGGTC